MSEYMLAFCLANLGNAIPSVQRYLGEVDETSYTPLCVGESYVVYALLFIFDRVDFLVRASEQPPFWAPSNLFRLVDTKIPANWEFRITQAHSDYGCLFDTFKISYIMGYPLLVNDYKHYAGIVERDPVEVLRFIEKELEFMPG
ncbi:hypothetical protein [Pseudomonas sp. Z3-8]|uniref:hypothetical protein n=1 Tax=Pseudomonas sp. Z3-8 TaxID=2817412 RepID=UPI003DA8138D